MLKKILLITAILIISSFSVFGATYNFDFDNDGFADQSNDVNDLEWRIYFKTYGGESGSNVPTLSVSGDASINLAIPDIEYQRAYWQLRNTETEYRDGEIIDRFRYTFEHFPSQTLSTARQNVNPGIYNFNLVAYGDGLNPSAPEQPESDWPDWEGLPCADPVKCMFPPCPPGYWEHFQDDNGICISYVSAGRCPTCFNNPNSCTETSSSDAYLCNGVWAQIDFYDGASYLFTIESDNWGNISLGEISYSKDATVWWTDSGPGTVGISQTIRICEGADECSPGATGCNGLSQSWNCILDANSCYIINYTDCDITEQCQAGVCVPGALSGAYWADMNDSSKAIIQADLNDRVRLMVTGTAMETREINYTIYRTNPFWFDKKIAQSSTLGFTSWLANETGTYWFEAEIEGAAGSQISGNLDVSSPEENTPPDVEILTPNPCDIYFTGETVGFNHTSYDEDDNITSYNWDFGDDATSQQANTTHIYSSSGQMTIVLTVTDERDLTAQDRTTIIIIDSSINGDGEQYVCAYIGGPEWGMNIQGFNVSFDAAETYAIEADNCGGGICNTLNCLAGDCKTQTANGLVNVLGAPNPTGFENLTFSWAFDDGTSYNAKGINGALFKKTFSYPGEHWAKLSASINPSSSIETSFKIINQTSEREVKEDIGKDSKKSKKCVIDKKIKGLIIIAIALIIVYIIWLSKKKEAARKKIKKKRK